VINADGTITFTPAPGFDGDATIEYTVSDGQGGEDTATVTVTVADAPRDGIVDGTDGDDVIVDGYVDPDGDAIDANDAILPGETGNDDIVLAGDGDDSIASGDGNDEVFGGTGSDTISGGDDDDIIYGDDENGNLDTSGVDPVELNFSDVEPGSETAGTANTATAGDSVVYNNVATLEDGTQVSARLVLVSTSDPALQVDLASEEDYEVLLNANNDGTMNGETATFRLEFFDTNTGDPVELEPSVVFADLDQNVGQEILSITDPNLVNVGVPADSSLDVTYTPGGSLTAAGTEDNIDPNDPDSQIATVFGETSEIEFTLTSRGVNSGLNFGTTDGNDFEYIVPIAGDDTIDGDDGNDIIYGGGGNDVIADGAGNDSIFGGEGNDIIDDEPGTPNDSLGDDYVDGGEGDDTIYTGLGNDTLIGGEGDDLLSGEDGDDVIDGGEGNDLVYGGEGNDVIDTSNPTDPLPDLAYPGLWPADSDPSNDLDTVFGGAGNDTILTGDDADYIDAGEGDNYVDGGIDEDTIITGSGNDTVIGGEGDDTITTGAGDDLIYGGLDDSFPDAINIPDADGDLVTNNGQDTIDAGAGNDTVFGKDDDDVIYGGDGDDYLDGGVDEDEIYGGADSDTIIGGEAADQLFGGTGSDTFFGGTSGDVVVGGEDADNLDQDVLDLTGSNVDFITYTSPDNEDGVVTFDDGSTMTFSEIENVIPCFTPGTLIATARGERPVEDLQVGDRIITRDNGIQEIAWVGHKQFQGADLVRNPHLKPVLIKAGSLGNDLPERDMLVSPNHRLLVASDMTQLYFEESEVLAAAKHMVGSQGIHRVDVTQTTYIHFMFERHEVVLSDGAWTESFQPGDYSLKGIGNSQRNEIFELFPELREKQGLQDYQAARKSLKKHEAKLLVR
jgi:Ca2+-binding RTX toxin-like protein